MQLPDEAVAFQYQNLLFQPKADEEWRPSTELQDQHFLAPKRIKGLEQQIMQVRSQIAAERDLVDPPASSRPLDSAFIDLPERMLTDHRRRKEASDVGRMMLTASRLQDQVDRVVMLGIGGSYLGARALFEALKSLYHNELHGEMRLGSPRMYFEGNNVDNDALQELLQLLQNTCVNPNAREERWATIVVSKSGKTLETAAALRVFRKEAAELYGAKSDELRQYLIPVSGAGESR